MCSLNLICSSRYLAPEYFMYGRVSYKTDVYAFGIVLLELITGRKPIDTTKPKGQENLVNWVCISPCSCNLTRILLSKCPVSFKCTFTSRLRENLTLPYAYQKQARPLLEKRDLDKLLDPRLEGDYNVDEMNCMILAAALCVRQSAHHRPRMSRVCICTS